MTTAKKLITVEDWLECSTEDRAELIEGELVYKAAPSSAHSDAQSAIARGH